MSGIVIYWKDLLLKSRIREQAQALNMSVDFLRTPDELSGRTEPVRLLIVDLAGGGSVADLFAGKLSGFRSIGVISHVDEAAAKAAEEAGFSEVMPRSKFVRVLGELLAGSA